MDALTAHAALVFTRYMLMSVAKRNDEDERTLGELFYFMVDEVADNHIQSFYEDSNGCDD